MLKIISGASISAYVQVTYLQKFQSRYGAMAFQCALAVGQRQRLLPVKTRAVPAQLSAIQRVRRKIRFRKVGVQPCSRCARARSESLAAYAAHSGSPSRGAQGAKSLSLAGA